jgi:type I restriction enzyme S subunit
MIRTTNVRGGWIDTGAVRHVDETTFRRWTRRGAPKKGDVILTREAPLGEVGMLRTSEAVFLGQRLYMYRADAARLDPYFLLYSMLDEFAQGQIRASGSGSTVEHMRLPDCDALRIRVPPLPVQHKIAALLSAYDDLIENNTRRVKVLEVMAQRVYREWFVEFRYPRHEGVSLIDTELGSIPEGWKLSALGEFVRHTSTTVNPGRFPDEQFHHFSIPAFDDGRTPRTESGRSILSNKFSIDAPCVLYSKLNPRIPRVWWADPLRETRAVASSELLVLRPVAPWNRALVYATLSSAELAGRVAGMAGGTSTSHQRVRPAELLSLPVVDPPPALCGAYERIAAPLLELSAKLRAGASILRLQRDLLLPRLISGEIDVEHLDIATEESAA